MRAIQVKKTGGPDALESVDLADPKPKQGEALVEIKASGVNFIDIYFREGRYPAPLPFVPGREGAGIVRALGEGVTTVMVGDRVAWFSENGSYATMQAVPAKDLVAMPSALSFEQAAAALLQGMTAHFLSHSTYPLKKDDTTLIHAGAGGVGLLLIQMAKQLGARVLTTVSTDEKANLAREAGADEVIEYTTQDFAKETLRLTDGAGVDVVYDSVGKTTFEKSLQVLRTRGMMVLFGGSSGPVPPFDLIRLAKKSLYVTRPSLNAYVESRVLLEARAHAVFSAVATGTLKVRIGQTYPLREAAQAHRDLESRKTTGKVLLIP
jgi:NADPH2:quinone reductase